MLYIFHYSNENVGFFVDTKLCNNNKKTSFHCYFLLFYSDVLGKIHLLVFLTGLVKDILPEKCNVMVWNKSKRESERNGSGSCGEI